MIDNIYNATGISRWTSAGRPHAVHIYKVGGMLCGKQFFSQEREPFNLLEITCDKCKRKYMRINKIISK